MTKWFFHWIQNGLDRPSEHTTNSMTKRNALKNRLLKTTTHLLAIHFTVEILWMHFALFKLHFSCVAGLKEGSYELVSSITGIPKCAFYFLYKTTRNNYFCRDNIFPQN